MKRNIYVIGLTVLLISGVLLDGCSAVIKKTAGPTTARDYNFTDFNSIDIGYAFKLQVTPADTYSITIDANESDFERIKVTRTGDKLEIGMDGLFFHFGRAPRVKITMPELRGLSMSGASEGSVTGFRSSDDLDLSLSGASELRIDMETGAFDCELSGSCEVTGTLTAASADIALSGASQIELTGSGGNVSIELSGASQADLEDFAVNDAVINFTGASDGSLEINGRLDVSLSGASELQYSGNPILGDLDITGGSSLKRR
jgi:hypothetical protein